MGKQAVGNCAECGRHGVLYRALCYKHYRMPECREKHRHLSGESRCPYSRRGHGNDRMQSLGRPAPTCAPRGSAAKILVMAERAKAMMDLFHPDDSPATVTLEERKAANEQFAREYAERGFGYDD